MLTLGLLNPSLYPKSPKSLKSQWILHAPQLNDPLECIEINDAYILSLGAHDAHRNYLLCVKAKPSLEEILLIEACISYVFDMPCAIVDPRFKRESTVLMKGFRNYYRKFHGPIHDDFFDPFAGNTGAVDIAAEYGLDSFRRTLNPVSPGASRWKIELPAKAKLKNALYVYRLASIASDPFATILNYWRCLESITTRSDRLQLFQDVETLNLSPVSAYDPFDKGDFDIMKTYVREAKLHAKQLRKKLGGSHDLSDYFYTQRRCPVAHANGRPLYFDSGISYGEILRDCILLKVVVRFAIEQEL
ncbi:hypothetical protein GC197_16685 [bacterium]|nr:hypothetical protein [bacterium]